MAQILLVDDEADIIPWLEKNHAVWITADLKAKRTYAVRLKTNGVSVVWMRQKIDWHRLVSDPENAPRCNVRARFAAPGKGYRCALDKI